MVKRKHYSKSKNSMGGIIKPFAGALGVVAYERFLSPYIPLQGTAKDVMELVAGYYLSKKGGIIGDTGKALVTLNAYQLTSSLTAGLNIGGLTQTNNGSW